MSVYSVSGFKFGDEKEYKAALEELRVINRLKEQTNMSDFKSVESLYAQMQSGEIRFNTVVGRAFDDEIYDLVKELEEKQALADEKSSKRRSGIRLKSAGKSKGLLKNSEKKSTDQVKKGKNGQTGKTERDSLKRRTGSENIANKRNVRNEKSNISEFKNSREIDAAAKEIIRKANLRRRIIIIAASVVAVFSLGYFIIYSRYAYASQEQFDELASLKGTEPVVEEVEQKPLFTLAEEEEAPEILDEYKNIYIKNKSVIGWLTIDDTNIDYPVMQTVNNDYYLNHDFNGKEDNNGSLFLDCNCNAAFRSTNLIIYGHHMKSGKMFGNLKKYESEEYCKEHNIIKFDTIYEKGVYEVMYVFRDTIKDAEDVSFKYYQFIDAVSEEEFDSNMKAMADMSLYDTGVTASYGDDILTLSTCNGSTSTARFVVVAKRIPDSEVKYVYK